MEYEDMRGASEWDQDEWIVSEEEPDYFMVRWYSTKKTFEALFSFLHNIGLR